MAYQNGAIVEANAPATIEGECRNACIAHDECQSWDFGKGSCRLRSNDGGALNIAIDYFYGKKHCVFESDIQKPLICILQVGEDFL